MWIYILLGLYKFIQQKLNKVSLEMPNFLFFRLPFSENHCFDQILVHYEFALFFFFFRFFDSFTRWIFSQCDFLNFLVLNIDFLIHVVCLKLSWSFGPNRRGWGYLHQSIWPVYNYVYSKIGLSTFHTTRLFGSNQRPSIPTSLPLCANRNYFNQFKILDFGDGRGERTFWMMSNNSVRARFSQLF